MKEKLSIYYDKEGDLLELNMGPCTEGRFKNLGDGCFREWMKEQKRLKARL